MKVVLIPRREFGQIWHKSNQDLLLTQASALAYTTLISLVPLLAVAFFIFHAYGGFESLQAQLQPLIEENLAPAFSAQMSQYLDNFVNNIHAGTIGVLGVVGFIFTSVSTLSTIERTFNMIWGANRQRSWAKKVTTYWSLLTIAPLLLGISLAVSSKALLWLKHNNGLIAHLLVLGLEAIPYVAVGVLFTCLYLFMPNAYVDKRDAAKAGFITGAVFEIAKFLYALYAARSLAHDKIYGSLVIIPVFLLWLFVVWFIILFGAELCCYFQFRRLKIPYRFNVEDRLSPFAVVDIIEALAAHQNKPGGGLTVVSLVQSVHLPLRELTRHLDFLQSEGWVIIAKGTLKTGNKYHLAVPREKVDFTKILSQLENRRYVPTSQTGMDVYTHVQKLWGEWDHFMHEHERPTTAPRDL